MTQITGFRNPERVDGTTPFHFAAKLGHIDICKIIVENIENKHPKDKMGNTPLMLAAENGHLEV